MSDCCESYKPCALDYSFIDDGSMSMYEKLCYLLKLFQDSNGNIDAINAHLASLDEAMLLRELSDNITNTRKLSEDGDFTGTWFGLTKVQLDALFSDINALIALKESSSDITTSRKLSATGDFTGLWFGESKASMDNRIKTGDFTGTWNSVTFLDLMNVIHNGDFLGTWDGMSKAELDLVVTGVQTGYDAILATLANNDQSFLIMEDDGYVTSAVTETVDYGVVIDDPTSDEDLGYVKYPCQC